MRKERYDITKTFEENKRLGPFGFETILNKNSEIEDILRNCGIETKLFGYETNFPLGVAAGPLSNSRFMQAAALDGFNLITWKTVRNIEREAFTNDGNYLGHNIVSVGIDGQLKTKNLEDTLTGSLYLPQNRDLISITNSFGMPSDIPEVWKPQVMVIEEWMKQNNKQTITSVVGTPQKDWGIEELANDYALCAKNAKEAGARIIELNFSCPNVHGKEGQIYKNPKDAGIICKKVRETVGYEVRILIKVGYSTKEQYKELVNSTHEYIDGFVAINTIPMKVVYNNGKQALPGGLETGTCGYGILDMAVDAVRNLTEIRAEQGLNYKVIGCGGITTPEAMMKHIKVGGADFTVVGTAALFKPELPYETAKYLRTNQIKMAIGK